MTDLNEDGFTLHPSIFTPPHLPNLITALNAETPIHSGRRNILDDPAVATLCTDPRITTLVEQALSPSAFAVRAILFDKSEASNWALAMHQDTKIAVTQRREVDGYRSWSVKDGIPHVMPPTEILDRQIALRIHLDPCLFESGPVEVIPNSHQGGILSGERITQLTNESRSTPCTGDAGSVLIFRSLLLHGSRKASRPSRRRILHLEFCDRELAPELSWRWRIPVLSNLA